MTIPSTTPTSLRRPGAYSEFQFLASGQQLVPLPLRVVIVAESKGGTATVETPIQIFSEADADTKLGTGSFAALMARDAFTTAKLKGSSPEIWACPIAEPGGGTAAQETITVTVTTAQAGNVVFTIGKTTITVGVSAGDTQNTIASAIQQAIASLTTVLPVTAAAPGANVVTCVNVTKGVNGNDVPFALVSAPTGVTVAFAQSVAGAGAASISNALNALYDRRYHAVAISNHTSTDITTLLTQRASDWSYTYANYRFYFMGCTGTLGTAQALQAAANDFGIVIVGCDSIPAMPGELAIATAVAEFAREAPNANLDGDVLPFPPPAGSKAWNDSQVESALSGGVTPLTPSGSFVKIERLVTSQTTQNGAPFEPLRDLAYPRTAMFLAEQIAIAFQSGFVQQVMTDDVLTRVRDMVVEKQRACEALGYIRDVDSFVPQIRAEFATSPSGRVVASNPFRPAGPLHQGVFVNVMYL